MTTIVFFDFYTDASGNNYAIVFFDDGSAVQVLVTSPYTAIPVAPAGIFGTGITSASTPDLMTAGVAGETVVCITSATGYFIWDGTNLFQQGTASPEVDLIDGGSNYSSAPSVMAFGGSGSGVALTATVSLGAVTQVKVTDPGSGYVSTDSAIVVFSGGGQGDSAYGTGILADGVVVGITVTNGGANYTRPPLVTITPVSGGSGAEVQYVAIVGGVVTEVFLGSGGSGYDQGAIVTFSDGGATNQATAFATIADGVIVGVNLVSNGSGYYSGGPATASGSQGPQGATTINWVCTSGSGATGTPVILNGMITGVNFQYPGDGGSGYQTPPIAQFTGGGGPASATLKLMPYGVLGNSIETYANRVWIADGNRILYTAPDSVVDFGNGGGAFQSVDGSLRFRYQHLQQANGFLYLIADASINYISGVVTASTTTMVNGVSITGPPITTFSLLNVDPRIGTPWPNTVQTLGRDIIFANLQGIYRILGGAVEKISDPIDNLFVNLPNSAFPKGSFYPSACTVTIYAQPCYALLLPVINPLTGETINILVVWNGKRWFTASQSIDLTFINQYAEYAENYGFGTDGTVLAQLFNQPGTLLKILQSRLWLSPDIVTQKKSWGIYALFQCYDDTTLNFMVDTEEGVFDVTQGTFAGTAELYPPVPTWARSAASAPAGQTIGFTMTSLSPDFALLTALLISEDYSLRT